MAIIEYLSMSGELKVNFLSEIDDSIADEKVLESLSFEVLKQNGEVY